LGGAVPAKPEGFQELEQMFVQYGVETFLESTNARIAILDSEGNPLSWNPSFQQMKQDLPNANRVIDFLSLSSKALFDEFLKKTLSERMRKQTNLEFIGENQSEFSTWFIPLPDQRVLFIAEPLHEVNHLEAITAELQSVKRSLANKETELKAVLVQADEVSHTDALTFLPNRKRIIADLQHEVMFADRYGTPLTISMLDIDHFKEINDTYGHIAGDEVLRKLAMELREHIRHPDSIGRYGGEEFLVILPHSTNQAAAEQAERLCRYVRSLHIQSGENEINVTISIGIAQYKIHKEDWQGFLSHADNALYQAKNNGRNQWMVSGE
jgi:diguanylate cyclase (GGDEF)-like protein